MKPLNRPMFKYGGPIKEGIMNGMKEKQAINTVGSPLAPKDETGRGGYAIPLLYGAGMAAMRFLPAAYRGFKAARAYKPFSQNLGIMSRAKDLFTPKAGLSAPMAPTGAGAGFRVGSLLRSNPLSLGLPVASMGLEAGTKAVKGIAQATPDLLKSYANTIIPFADPFTVGEKPPVKESDKTGIKRGDKNKVVATPNINKPDKDAEGAKQEINEDRINETKQKYYKLMGIDKMKKDAVYDSLIDASKIIQEEGADLKGSIKSGTLQNKIIQAISGQLDKSAALKKQIDAAVLKGEIEKDIKANDPSAKLAAEYTKKRIDLVDKQLAGGDLDDIAGEYRKQGLSLKGQSLFAEASRKGIDTKGILPTENVDKFMNDNPTLTEADFVNVYQEQLVEAGKNKLPAGDYVVGGRIITVGDDGKAKAFVY